MTEEGNIGLEVLAALGAGKFIDKLFGPTISYLGEGLKSWTQHRTKRFLEIAEDASNKLGEKLHEDASIHPRVLKGVVEEGTFTTDDISIHYYGGVLASSRSRMKEDDRGVTFNSLLSSLSSYQLRGHYIIYHVFRQLSAESKDPTLFNLEPSGLSEYYLDIKEQGLYKAMGFEEEELRKANLLIEHTLSGLDSTSLLKFEKRGKTMNSSLGEYENHYHIKLTFKGIELFLWAYGKGDVPPSDFNNPAYNFEVANDILIPSKPDVWLSQDIDFSYDRYRY